MNDTPQGDGNFTKVYIRFCEVYSIRMNDTPQGDGNFYVVTTTFILLRTVHKNE